MTAARRPVTVRERILRLLHTTLAASLAASRDTLAQHARTGLLNAPTHPGAALTDTAGADPRPPAPAATTHAQRSDDTPS